MKSSPALVAASLVLSACGADRSEFPRLNRDELVAEARELFPGVEEATGLEFRTEPDIELRSREQVRAYLLHQLETTVPAEDLNGVELAYRLFGLLPDTLDLGDLLLELYSEQVVAYYDPDSSALYVVDRTDPVQVQLVLAHELVHALQDQYTDVDSLMSVLRDSDRSAAYQAVLEGQATLASIKALLPDRNIQEFPGFWEQAREAVLQNQQAMPVFAAAPRVIREAVLFPYLAGADFVRWFNLEYPDTVPFGRLMPQSTEQIMHPQQFLQGDVPVRMRYVNEDEAVYTDNLGELGVRVLLTELSGNEARGVSIAQGWDGDRFAVFNLGESDHGLVWWTVWDDEASARRFALTVEREWRGRQREGREFSVARAEFQSQPAVVLVDGRPGWVGLTEPPRVESPGSTEE